MTVLDLGANVGYYTLIAAHLVGPRGRVHAFEPDPESYDLLVKSVRLNGHTNVTTVCAAVADRAERGRLYLDSGRWGQSLSERNIAAPVGSVEVETVTLDGLLESGALGPRVDVIKIDVQGAEGLVRKGAGRLLQRDRPKILMELEPDRLRNLGTDPLELLRAFVADGYAIHPIDPRAEFDAPITLERIVALAEAAGVINRRPCSKSSDRSVGRPSYSAYAQRWAWSHGSR